MNKIFYSLILLTTTQLSAQVTLESLHMVATGRTVVYANDNSNFAFPSNGSNQTWDFTNLKSSLKDSTRFGMPFWYKGNTYFPEANFASIKFSDTSNVFYRKIEQNAMYELGNFASSDTSFLIYKLKLKTLSFPSTYQTAFNDVAEFAGLSIQLGFDIDSTGPMPYLDSMRFSTRISFQSNINGFGMLKTPLGQFDALKQSTLKQTSQVVYVYANNQWVIASQAIINYLNLSFPEIDSLYNVSFWTNSKNVGVPLLSYKYFPKDTVVNSIHWLFTKPHFNSISQAAIESNLKIYPNPFQDILNIELPIKGSYRVLNSIGQVMVSSEFNQVIALESFNWQSGMYFLQIFDENKQLLLTKKVIKQ